MVSLAWVHLLCLDLFTARYVFLDCLKVGVEHRLSVVLCFMFGPLGLLRYAMPYIEMLNYSYVALTKYIEVKRDYTFCLTMYYSSAVTPSSSWRGRAGPWSSAAATMDPSHIRSKY